MAKNISRATTLIMGIIIGFVILSSAIFIIKNSDHDCSGDNCSVCAAIKQCEQNLEKLGTVGAEAAAIIAVVFAFIEVICTVKSRTNASTLIKLKVELLN